ncbi:MAG: 1-acyl-sn-glycerol-3-phosphate acyltransferase [Pseudomonadota bacterium]
MSQIFFENDSNFDRVLIATRPLAAWLAGCFAKQSGEVEAVPHPSAMLADPNWLYRMILPRFFRKITVDEAAVSELAAAAARSTIVYVAKGLGQLEYNYFNDLFVQRGLPLASYTNALTLRRWMRWRDFWKSVGAQAREISKLGRPADPLRDRLLAEMIARGKSALLVIPPSALFDDALFETGPLHTLADLIEAQKRSERPISIVTLDFLWSRRPENTERSLVDILFGEKESPGAIRKTVLFWRNYKGHAQAAVGRPLDLASFVGESPEANVQDTAMRLRSKLMESLKAKRRAITGPAARPRKWFEDAVIGDESLDIRICEIAAERGKSADEVRDLAARYIREIAADVDYTYIELLDKLLAHVFSRLYDSFNVDTEGLMKAKELHSKGPIVFVPNHKSHVDYLLLSYILYHNGMTVPHIAAGINLRFWPVGGIFRHCGAYFIRRAFRGNDLYRAVLATYLKVLLREGYSQEFFIEGGRSRTGKLCRPRMGMLSMLHEAAREGGVANLHFVPVSITYDRVIEQKSYMRELEGEKKEEEGAGHLLGLTKFLRRQRHRYGSIYVRFGEAVPAAQDISNASAVADVAQEICLRINRNAVATPAAVAAAAMLAPARRGITIGEIKRNWDAVLAYLSGKGVDISERIKSSPDTALDEALAQLAGTRLLSVRRDSVEPFVSVGEERRVPIAFFRNGVVHFLATIGVTSHLIARRGAAGCREHEIVAEFEICRRLLAHEFSFATRGPVEEHVKGAIDYLVARNAVARADGSIVRLAPGGEWTCALFASQIRPFAETLWIALRHASEKMNAAVDERTLVSEMMRTGHDLLLLEQVKYREAITKAAFENALRALVIHNVLSREPSAKGTKRRNIYTPSGDQEAAKILKAELETIL